MKTKVIRIPVLIDKPLVLHGPDELMYTKDGHHWYYPGEEPEWKFIEVIVQKFDAEPKND